MSNKTDEEIDRLLRVLADTHRRYALKYLRTRSESVTVTALAEEIADRDQAIPSDPVEQDAIERISLALCHVHVPKLADSNLVRYDEDRETVAPTDCIEAVAPLLPNPLDP